MPPPKSNKHPSSRAPRKTSPSPNRGGAKGSVKGGRNSVKGKAGKKNSAKDEDEYPCIKLNNGVEMPIVALGCWNLKQAWSGSGYNSTGRAVEFALENGYRHIDTAERFENLNEVGLGIQNFLEKQRTLAKTRGTPPMTRKDLFITSKIWAVNNSNVTEGYINICKQLRTDHLDVVYLHLPCALVRQNKVVREAQEDKPSEIEMLPLSPEGDLLFDESIDFIDTWKQMEKLLFEKKVNAIGVANFNKDQLERLLKVCCVKPQVLQVEVHPLMKNLDLLDFCRKRGIIVSAYGPQGNINNSAQGWEALKTRLQKNLNLKAGEKINLSKFVKLALNKKSDASEQPTTALNLRELSSQLSTPENTEIPPTPKVTMKEDQKTDSGISEGDEPKSTVERKSSVPPKSIVKKPSRTSRTNSEERRSTVERKDSNATKSSNDENLNDPSARMSQGLPRGSVMVNSNSSKFQEEAKIRTIASSHSAQSNQVILRWALQLGCALVQNTWEISSIRHSNAVFRFELAEKEMTTLMEMDKYNRSYPMLGFRHHKFYPFAEDENIIAQHEVRENERARVKQLEILEKRKREAEMKRRTRNASGESKVNTGRTVKNSRAQASPAPSTRSGKSTVFGSDKPRFK